MEFETGSNHENAAHPCHQTLYLPSHPPFSVSIIYSRKTRLKDSPLQVRFYFHKRIDQGLPVVLTYHPLYNRSAKSASEGDKRREVEGVGIKRKERKSNPQSNTGQRSRRFQSWATIRYTRRYWNSRWNFIGRKPPRGEIRESVYTVFEKHARGRIREAYWLLVY